MLYIFLYLLYWQVWLFFILFFYILKDLVLQQVNQLNFYHFIPIFFLKDLVAFCTFMVFFMTVVCFFPNALSDPDNYIKANPLVTPPHIVPEWYFLFFYAILRTIPNKLLGVVYLLISILILFIFPILDSSDTQYSDSRLLFITWFWFFVANVITLSWLGAQPLNSLYLSFSKLCIFNFFADIFIIFPIAGWLENERFKKINV